MLNKVEIEYATDQPMNQRIGKYFNDVEMQDFVVTSKKADEGEKCLECHHSNPEAKQDVTQTQFEIKDTTSSSRKLLATVTHCGNIECLLASVLSIPEIKELNSKGAQPINEDTRANPTFRLLNITTSWRVAATNLKTKLWLQEAMNKINEIEDLVLQKRKEICANETSTNEDIAKVSEAVRHVRELTDQQSTMKSALRGEMSQRTNASKNFEERVKKINDKFEPLKQNLDETEADKALRAKNQELQNAQNLAAGMTATIITLKKESATLAKDTAQKRVMTLSQITKAIDMTEIAEAKANVVEHRSTSDKKIALQVKLAQDVAATAQKLNELGLPWLTVNIDDENRKMPFIDPLADETFIALHTLTDVASKVVQAKKEQRIAKKQLLQILLDERESIKRDEIDSNGQQKDNKKAADTEIEKLRTENETLKRQSKIDTAEIA